MGTLSELNGTKWVGAAELWPDPLGDNVVRSDCTMSVDDHVVRYTWSHEGKGHEGSITLRDDGADFTDSWHSGEPMRCRRLADAWGLFQVQGEYGPEARTDDMPENQPCTAATASPGGGDVQSNQRAFHRRELVPSHGENRGKAERQRGKDQVQQTIADATSPW